MRKLYLQLIEVLAKYAERAVIEQSDIATLLMLISSGEAPSRDQDINDLLSELRIFILFGWTADRKNNDGAIRDWPDFWRRFYALQQ